MKAMGSKSGTALFTTATGPMYTRARSAVNSRAYMPLLRQRTHTHHTPAGMPKTRSTFHHHTYAGGAWAVCNLELAERVHGSGRPVTYTHALAHAPAKNVHAHENSRTCTRTRTRTHAHTHAADKSQATRDLRARWSHV
jgi:hypothetical protein